MTGMGGSMAATPLDCGPNGYVVENHGPPSNRVNYIILGDGFTTADNAAGGAFEKDIANSMVRRFSPNAFPYNRYRNFVNICGIKLVSTGAICGSSTLGCCGDDSSRLANCNMTSVNAAYNALPKTLTIDWRAVMLNGNSWWNSGGTTMLYSGGNTDAPGAALHEGGHGFHQLADEYGTCTGAGCGSNTNSTGSTGTVDPEVNSCGNPTTTDGKWDLWIGYNAIGATGIQSTFENSRYVGTGQYRPSANSMMNSLFCGNSNQATCTANTAYNQVSREQIVMSIWKRHQADRLDRAGGGCGDQPRRAEGQRDRSGRHQRRLDCRRHDEDERRRHVRYIQPGRRQPHGVGEGLRQRRRRPRPLQELDLSVVGHRQLLPPHGLEELDPDGHLDVHEVTH